MERSPRSILRDPINTYATAINDSGVIVGQYEDGSFVYHGFVRKPNGKIKSFDYPGSINTYADWNNDSGEITGIL